MPRTARQTPGGYVYHVLNRGTARLKLFRKAADYDTFLRVLKEGSCPISIATALKHTIHLFCALQPGR
jgi:putative transposase